MWKYAPMHAWHVAFLKSPNASMTCLHRNEQRNVDKLERTFRDGTANSRVGDSASACVSLDLLLMHCSERA